MQRKMVLIGCGSAMFTRGLVADLIRNPAGRSWHLALCDVDGETLEAVQKLVRKMVAAGAPAAGIEVSASDRREDLLPGADYVVSTIGVGKRAAWEHDVLIPRQYGVFQPVGDTAMPGGLSRAMRMAPATLAIVRDCERLCPNARFINYANPMAILCRAAMKASSFPVTGLCIGTADSVWHMADMAGLPRGDVTARAVGMNHLTFIYRFMHGGGDAMPRVKKALVDRFGAGYFDESALDPERPGPDQTPGHRFCWSFLLKHGAFPAPGDRHVAEFFVERFPGGRYYGKRLGVDVFSFEDCIAGGDRIHAETLAVANDPAPLPEDWFRRIGGEHGQLMEIVDSIEHDRGRTYFANLPNRGAVPALPPESVLEMPCVATAQGMRPLQAPDFPAPLAALVQKNLAIVEMAAEAALKGEVRLFEEAILMGGYITDARAVSKLVAELLRAHKAHLPQFA